jgi:hypothetical protein
MDSLPYLDTLLKEYLLFRGFTSTVRVFESERRGDKAAGFRVERLVDLVFEQYVPQYDAPRLLELLDFLASRFFSKLPHNGQEGAKRLRESILRYYLIYATQNGRPDKVFTTRGETLERDGLSRAATSRPGELSCRSPRVLHVASMLRELSKTPQS